MTNVTSIDPQRLPYKLNSLLPHDIRVCWMSQTAPDFNVTVSAKHKVWPAAAAAAAVAPRSTCGQ
jgi:tRNA U38,U39,U40 pseudouridine synthase TruA